MCKPAARLGDICTGHDCWPPRPIIQASPNVIVNGRGWARRTDALAVHCCGPFCHSGVLASGSSTVLINNLNANRIGDPVSCGGVVATGSHNVVCGG